MYRMCSLQLHVRFFCKSWPLWTKLVVMFLNILVFLRKRHWSVQYKRFIFIFLLIDKTWRFYLKYMICFQACNLIYRPQEETLKCSWAASFTLYASSLYIFDSWPTLILFQTTLKPVLYCQSVNAIGIGSSRVIFLEISDPGRQIARY